MATGYGTEVLNWNGRVLHYPHHDEWTSPTGEPPLMPPVRDAGHGRPYPRGRRCRVEILMLTARADAPSVLAALDLLPHTVRTAPRDVRTLLSGPTPDTVMVDARSELAEAR